MIPRDSVSEKGCLAGFTPELSQRRNFGVVSPRDWAVVTFTEKGMISPENEIKNVAQGQMISVGLKSAGAKAQIFVGLLRPD
jgi:hypothetical protein